MRLGISDAIARGLGIEALRVPSYPGGGAAKVIDARRLEALSRQGGSVSRVLGQGGTTLLLSDIGSTLAAYPREAGAILL